MELNDSIIAATDIKKKAAAKQKRKKLFKRVVASTVIIAALGGIGFGMWKLFHEEDEEQQLWTDVVYTGSIQTTVNGSGVAQPKDSATLTLSAAGTVLDVYVSEGDWVNEGDPLYTIDSTEAREAVDAARETVNDYQKQIDAVNEEAQHLTASAPFSGKLMDVAEFEIGSQISAGTKLATIVDDSNLILKLYFNYVYKDSVYEGQSATVSVPGAMVQLEGTVKKINYVEYVSPEGGIFFEVNISVKNPGTFSDETVATAELTASDGNAIYPYNEGTMQYARKSDVIMNASGKILSANLMNYSRVSSGERLMQVGDDTCASRLAELRTSMKAAQDILDNAQAKLADFDAVAPMNGTVIQCSIAPGNTVEAGYTAVSIADTSVMIVSAQVDEMNISYVHPGMFCDIVQWGRDGEQHFFGTVDTVSLEGTYENGVSFFPATISVENPDGRLMSGMYVDYNMDASQSENCLLVPVQAVKYTAEGTCLFIAADSAPENALNSEELGIDLPEGFYAVPVTVGLSDNACAEIISGVEDGTTVFVQYMTNSGDSYGYMMF